MSYTIRLVYYGRVDFKKTKYNSETDRIETQDLPSPQVSTQNIRIVPFSVADPESFPEIAIYELVKNEETKTALKVEPFTGEFKA